jgi:nicotinamide mononucleotide transporter
MAPMDEFLQIAGTVLGVAYVVMLIDRRVLAWPFGIASCLIMAYSFWVGDSPLYLETVSNVVYAVVGLYGWNYWHRQKGLRRSSSSFIVKEWHWSVHLVVVLGGIGLSFAIFLALRQTNDARPLADSLSTVFALLATWMQARKVLSNWLYWIIIDLGLAVLYAQTGYGWYAGLMVVYVALAIWGYLVWRNAKI